MPWCTWFTAVWPTPELHLKLLQTDSFSFIPQCRADCSRLQSILWGFCGYAWARNPITIPSCSSKMHCKLSDQHSFWWYRRQEKWWYLISVFLLLIAQALLKGLQWQNGISLLLPSLELSKIRQVSFETTQYSFLSGPFIHFSSDRFPPIPGCADHRSWHSLCLSFWAECALFAEAEGLEKYYTGYFVPGWGRSTNLALVYTSI